ncbi:hypothetical protein TREMEDRAFT_72445 [Tremella mesenterica DSM 1558]|uniref:uncharacterized protein n=1 Tax=Tremella mesenterica (strain ATCC 24925 / CBS 8224 / DSM 1558 / NBRC 9311 / NRRL Y-6157 / RJB 2259-6 / UBC 559-6) TaxID=578456 RepID=UPI00032CD119|nr:uncharacterized protein TREMEDRAFT_72445 [Tremella mesenterica DSM 1558]EIW66132.1 hypothetical protein TREMEDRAFT_72445 [Tremella mesenterica DSM 1558]
MVKSYFRHGPTQAFGVITSPTANCAYDGKLAYVPAWEDVLVWDMKLGEMVSMWHSPSLISPITRLLPSPSSNQTFAVAYQDGSIRLWSSSPPTEIVTFNGHRKSPTFLAWDDQGTRLASGGTEGEIVIWDVVGEVGLYRLKGHRGAITGLKLIPSTKMRGSGWLVSCSRDNYLKLWDLSTQHCVQTVVVGRGEVVSLDIIEEVIGLGDEDTEVHAEEEGVDEENQKRGRWLVVTGSGDGEAKVWTIEKSDLARGLKTTDGELGTFVKPLCSLPLPSNTQPISQISFHPTLPLLLLQNGERTITVLRIRTEEEVGAKRARRKKREREKGKKKQLPLLASATNKSGLTEKGDDVGEEGVEKGTEGGEEEEGDDGDQVKWEEKLTSLCVVRTNAKIRSFAFDEEVGKGGVSVLVQLSNNSLETYTLPLPSSSSRKLKNQSTEPIKTHSLELPGHRQDPRTLCISSDDQVIASASSGTLKLWNSRTTACLRTMECGYALCSTFLPGDRHVVIGTKTGELALYDIAGSTLLESYKVHKGPIWGIQVRPDGRGLVSCSGDHDVKFFDFSFIEEEEQEPSQVLDKSSSNPPSTNGLKYNAANGKPAKDITRVTGVMEDNRDSRSTRIKPKRLTLIHTRTLKLTDDILSIRFSPNGKLLAVALLDTTVKLFFTDTLKFFLSLYGHRLPVLSMDISDDNKLLVTCGADKSVKIWGLDFGDCHRSLYAHDESVMSVRWEKGGHMFWSVGKDGLLKYWDGDKFELVQTLRGHQAEIWSLAVSNNSSYVVTSSHDKSIRIWEKTDEPLFLEEEREKELEQMYDTNLVDSLNPRVEKEGGEEVEGVGKQTNESLIDGEKIVEALEVAERERKGLEEWRVENGLATNSNDPSSITVQSTSVVGDQSKVITDENGEVKNLTEKPTRPTELESANMSGGQYVYKVVKGVKTAGMEDALVGLSFGSAMSLLRYLNEWAKDNIDPILTARIARFILSTHSTQLVVSRDPIIRSIISSLRTNLRKNLTMERDRVGYNLAGLRYLKGKYELESGSTFVDTFEEVEKKGKGGKKRKRVEVRV